MNLTAVWAHRGASSQQPENTLAAFELAIRQRADGVELDVQRTADGVIVVVHDEDCQRLTGQPGLVSQMSFTELRQRNFAWHWPNAGLHRLPTLAEVFDLIRPSSLTINIELKNSLIPFAGLEEQVLRLAADHGFQDRITLSSFNHYSMLNAIAAGQALNFPVPCGLLYSCGLVDPWVYARRIGAAAINPHYVNLQIPELVSRTHNAGLAIHAWTIDDPEDQKRALALHIDALITNRPEQALAIRAAHQYTGEATP